MLRILPHQRDVIEGGTRIDRLLELATTHKRKGPSRHEPPMWCFIPQST
jgi:hypothetical protein